MSNESLYTRRAPSYSAKIFAAAPETFKPFGEFNKLALSEGLLSVRVKELIAVAAAHLTGCPYCIEAHVGKAKAADVSLPELVEAIAVAAAVNAHAVYYHAVNAIKAFEGSQEGDLYPHSNLALGGRLAELGGQAYAAYTNYEEQALASGAVSEQEKLLIAVGAALITGSAYSIELYTAQAKDAGIALGALSEALAVAAALNAGAVVAHRNNLLQAYERE